MKARMWLTGFPLWQGRKECLKFVDTFPRQNAPVQMKAPRPSPIKPADDREEVRDYLDHIMKGNNHGKANRN
jgi:hypothetical protein